MRGRGGRADGKEQDTPPAGMWRSMAEEGLVSAVVSEARAGRWTLLVTEWLEAPWETLFAAWGGLGPEERTSLRAAVEEAVPRMRSRSIVHGDLRARNITLTPTRHAAASHHHATLPAVRRGGDTRSWASRAPA